MISPRLNKLLAATGITVVLIGLGAAMTYTPVGPPQYDEPLEFKPSCHIVHETEHVMFPSNIVVAESYVGTFVWDANSFPQKLELTATESQTINSNSGIVRVISGHGTYRVGGVTEFDFQIKILNDGTVEMIESNPSTANFITDGRHVGEVEEDGTIRARWEDNRFPDRSGTLVLRPQF